MFMMSSHYLLLFALILAIFSPSSLAQNISINDSLTATESSTPRRSPNGDFAFGFQQLQSNSDLFVLSIWFDKIPNKTVVWYERSSYPVRRGSTLQLDARLGLVLRDPQGTLLYNTSSSLGDQVAQGSIQDTGNLVLTGTNSSNILWQSFSHPADTILPTQTIEINQMLISRKTETDFSQGRFYARMNDSGNFVLSAKTTPLSEVFDTDYYSSSTSNVGNTSISGFGVVFNATAVTISVVASDGSFLKTLIDPVIQGGQYYYRATLGFDGVFTLYYHPRIIEGNPQWTGVQGLPADANAICRMIGKMGSGGCGYNSFCVVRNGRPVCECPPSFSLVDPNNTHGDCKSDFVQNCIQGQDEECGLEAIRQVNWPEHDYERLNPTTEQQCRDACLDDYSCTVAVYDGRGCWKKNLPLSNGRGDDGPAATVFLKRGKPLNQNPEKSKRDQKVTVLVLSLILGSSVLANLFFTGAACFGFFPARINLVPDTNTPGSNLRCYTYKQLVHATDGFKDELGRGAFGIVYKGVMPDDSRTAVAVKKLDRVAQDSEKEFRTEVNVIGQIHHKNVVRLLGFCDEGPNRLLVYECMTNGSLASYLHSSDLRPSWRQRTEIAVGVARGLAYLHEECITQIIHCDIKPQNILLDDNYTARISDFGLAKLLMLNQSRTMTNIRGTKGYVSPEWFRNTLITTKVDVYSFGVVLLEIVSCRKAVSDVEFEGGGSPIMTEWAWECYLEGRLDILVENDEETCSDGKRLERFVKVGFWCIQEDAGLRPTMRNVCQMLEGTIDVAKPPCPSSYTFATT